MLTLDLKKSNNHDTVHGKLILNISTNVNVPIRNGTNTLAPGSRANASSTSVASTPSEQPSHPPPPPAEASSPADNNRNSDLPDG
jgi:E3 ubiquitin-protein ligase NEDD4